jgi:hypothetical protein
MSPPWRSPRPSTGHGRGIWYVDSDVVNNVNNGSCRGRVTEAGRGPDGDPLSSLRPEVSRVGMRQRGVMTCNRGQSHVPAGSLTGRTALVSGLTWTQNCVR